MVSLVGSASGCLCSASSNASTSASAVAVVLSVYPAQTRVNTSSTVKQYAHDLPAGMYVMSTFHISCGLDAFTLRDPRFTASFLVVAGMIMPVFWHMRCTCL